jgi:hypothetical protein
MAFSIPSNWRHFQRVGYFMGLAPFSRCLSNVCHEKFAWKYNEDSVLRGTSLFFKNKFPMFDHGFFAGQSWANREHGFLGTLITEVVNGGL